MWRKARRPQAASSGLNLDGTVFTEGRKNTKGVSDSGKLPSGYLTLREATDASGFFLRANTGLLGLGLLQQRGFEGRRAVRPRRELVLQWSPPGVECVVDVVVEEAAQRRHVDVGKPRQPPQEVGGILVCAEQAPKLGIEETFGHFSEISGRKKKVTEKSFRGFFKKKNA